MSYCISREGIPCNPTYTEARKHFDSVKAWRGHTDKPIAQRRHTTKRMRMEDDGTIVYTHHRTDILWVHPNGDLTVRGYASTTTSCLLNHLLPSGISHKSGGYRGDGEPVLYLYDKDGNWYGRWERYRQPGDTYDRWRRIPPEKPADVIRCDRPVKLRFDDASNRWRPISRLEPFEWRKLGKRAKQLTKQLNFAEFKQVLPALQAFLPREHQYGRSSAPYPKIADLLVEKRYAEAFDLCDLSWEYRSERWKPGCNHADLYELKGVSQTCLNKVRDHYCVAHGATVKHSARVLTLPQYNTYRANRRRFG